ncbi:MAG TPA: aldo/keto reductase [Bryobacteraceae bacterium]|jgi:L-galactose dehydrogenase|nr:aldo/keto reductase [Bryobacteraceae bacterium]
MEYRVLGKTGLQLSVIGFGASPLGNEFGAVDPKEGERAVHLAIDQGINFFDVSPFYGRTLAEERLGAALAGRRERVVLSTKCGRYDLRQFDFSAARVQTSIEESLRRLQTDFVDLLIAHDIEFGDPEQIIHETIPAMRKLQAEGKTRWVGISGLPLPLLAGVAVRAEVDFVLSYCHYNLLVRDLDRDLTPVLRERGTGLVNASPLHMRVLSEAGPPDWHPASEVVKQAGAKIVALCKEHGVDPAILALRFCLDHPYVSSTLVGMSATAEVNTNLKALDFQPDPALLREIEQIVSPVNNAA